MIDLRGNVKNRYRVVHKNELSMWVAILAILVIVGGCVTLDAHAQSAGAPQNATPLPAPPQKTARASAPKDFTGYWVSVVTEQWHLRMLMPPKGEFALLPLNAEARAAANTWSPAQDAGNECRAYGAPVIMRVPGRLHIHWMDDNTLEVDTDAGNQTRMFHFGASAKPTDPQPTWQGYSAATWAGTPVSRTAKVPGPAGDLRVVTTQLKAGYLRKNGAPYSEKTTVDEYFDTFTEPDNNSWLVVTSIVTDPQYLTDPYAYTVHFKKIPNGQGWDPAPCVADEVR